MSEPYVQFDDMTWPHPFNDSDTEWAMRYGSDMIVKEKRMCAASYIAAYKQLFQMDQKTRNKRIEQIKKAANNG